MTCLPEEAYAAALATLPGSGPAGLRALLSSRTPRAAWRALLGGQGPAVAGACGDPNGVAAMRAAARRTDVAAVWRRHQRAGVRVLLPGGPGFPAVLDADPRPPAVLFSLGDPTVIGRGPAVAIVGTRSATRYGLGVAAELGAALGATGVSVVSGLALGIDGAAHEGAVAARRASEVDGGAPIGVVAGGLDHPYPPQHARLWERLADVGTILSEAPVGGGNQRWRFPQRNRVLAALADVVVVVESHLRGGAIHTVEAALERATPVGAVPGSVRSPASSGTNQLLADGAFPVRDVADVLVALELVRPEGTRLARPGPSPNDGRARAGARRRRVVGAAVSDGAGAAPLDGAGAAVLAVLDWEPAPLEHLVVRSGCSVAQVALALEELVARGEAQEAAGWWSRR